MHWPEYLIEASLLGLFMISACGFGALLEYPGSPVHQALPGAFVRRALMGLAMGTTAVALIFSPWRKRSGAHFNPATTLTFYRLGKIERADAVFYVLSQFAGGIAGVLLASVLIGTAVAHPMVNYVVTLPGKFALWVAFAAEVGIAFLLMTVILNVSNTPRLARWTGLFAGALVAMYITFEAPISGMSLNPARTFGSAIWANTWMSLWIYFTAPVLGMLLAAQVYTMQRGLRGVICAKLHHQNSQRCIFRCGYARGVAGRDASR